MGQARGQRPRAWRGSRSAGGVPAWAWRPPCSRRCWRCCWCGSRGAKLRRGEGLTGPRRPARRVRECDPGGRTLASRRTARLCSPRERGVSSAGEERGMRRGMTRSDVRSRRAAGAGGSGVVAALGSSGASGADGLLAGAARRQAWDPRDDRRDRDGIGDQRHVRIRLRRVRLARDELTYISPTAVSVRAPGLIPGVAKVTLHDELGDEVFAGTFEYVRPPRYHESLAEEGSGDRRERSGNHGQGAREDERSAVRVGPRDH